MYGIAFNGPALLFNTLKMVKILKQSFWKILSNGYFIDRRGYRSNFLHQIVAIPWLYIVKKTKSDHFHGGRKLFSVDFYDLITMSFKFDNNIIITFKMPVILQKVLFKNQHFVAILSISFRGPWIILRRSD